MIKRDVGWYLNRLQFCLPPWRHDEAERSQRVDLVPRRLVIRTRHTNLRLSAFYFSLLTIFCSSLNIEPFHRCLPYWENGQEELPLLSLDSACQKREGESLLTVAAPSKKGRSVMFWSSWGLAVRLISSYVLFTDFIFFRVLFRDAFPGYLLVRRLVNHSFNWTW